MISHSRETIFNQVETNGQKCIVVNPMRNANHPQVITILMGWIQTTPSHGSSENGSQGLPH
jgi:hypothetical protein